VCFKNGAAISRHSLFEDCADCRDYGVTRDAIPLGTASKANDDARRSSPILVFVAGFNVIPDQGALARVA
jgi:hypothetical protein